MFDEENRTYEENTQQPSVEPTPQLNSEPVSQADVEPTPQPSVEPASNGFVLVGAPRNPDEEPVQPTVAEETQSTAANQQYAQSTASYQQEEKTQYSDIPVEPAEAQGGKKRKATKKKKKGGYLKAIACAIVCGVIIGGCIIGSFAIGKNVVQTYATVETTTAKLSVAESSDSETTQTVASSGEEYTVTQIAEQCSSSVVAITSKSVSEVITMFGTYEQESSGSGSGVIIAQSETELIIVTNYHVIEDTDELTVCLLDSEEAVYSAQVKGTDESNDLAVIAVALSDMDEEILNQISIATVGDSDALKVGDGVVAIGNALGLGQSVTAGIISALDREVTIDDSTYHLLQTDAAINAGNSGGALFNMKGELIGINTAKFSSDSSSSSASIDNMGFAIPMATAQPIIETLMNMETRTKLDSNYGCLNIAGRDVSSDVAAAYGMPEGVYVVSVVENAAAAKAGIQAGDIITALDGVSITSITTLKEKLQYYAAGETVEITLSRSNNGSYESMTVTVTLDNASEQDTSAIESSVNESSSSSSSDSSDSQSDTESDMNSESGMNSQSGMDSQNGMNSQGSMNNGMSR